MTFGALRIDPEDDDIQSAHIRPGVAELAELLATDQGVITGIEDQHDILAPQGGEFDLLAGLRGRVKSGALEPTGRGSRGNQENIREPIS